MLGVGLKGAQLKGHDDVVDSGTNIGDGGNTSVVCGESVFEIDESGRSGWIAICGNAASRSTVNVTPIVSTSGTEVPASQYRSVVCQGSLTPSEGTCFTSAFSATASDTALTKKIQIVNGYVLSMFDSKCVSERGDDTIYFFA